MLDQEDGDKLVLHVDLHIGAVGPTMTKSASALQGSATGRPRADRPSQTVSVAILPEEIPRMGSGHLLDNGFGQLSFSRINATVQDHLAKQS